MKSLVLSLAVLMFLVQLTSGNRTLEKKKCGLKLVPGPGFEFPCSVVAGVEFSLARSGEEWGSIVPEQLCPTFL